MHDFGIQSEIYTIFRNIFSTYPDSLLAFSKIFRKNIVENIVVFWWKI